MTEGARITVSEDYLRGLEKKIEALTDVVKLFSTISATLDLEVLIKLVMEQAKRMMEAEGCSILLYNRKTKKLEFEVTLCDDDAASGILKEKVSLDLGQGIAGWVAANQEPLVIDDVTKDSRFYSGADRLTGFTTRNLSAFPLVGRRGLIGVAEIINTRKKDLDPELLKILCRQFAIAIENALYHRESLERERLRQELRIASEVQKSFLPQEPVFSKGRLTVSAVNIPASKVGGDIYDFTEPAEGKAGVLIGDVSGKGISAALYMAKIISDFRYTAHLEESPEVVLNRLNSRLSAAPMGMFLTAIYMVVDLGTGEAALSGAGHPPMLLVRDGEVRVMDVLSGPPLGILPLQYPCRTLSLREGDTLLLLTDGVFEAKNPEGERIGFNRIVEFVRQRGSGEGLLEGIVEYVNGFSRGVEKGDDITLVEVRWA